MKYLYVGGPLDGQEYEAVGEEMRRHPILRVERATGCFGRAPTAAEYHWLTYYRYPMTDGTIVYVHDSLMVAANYEVVEQAVREARVVVARRRVEEIATAVSEGLVPPPALANADPDTPKTDGGASWGGVYNLKR